MTSAFRHEALLYAGSEDFVNRTSDFVRQGLENDEPVLVMVTADKFEAIRSQLGPDSRRVRFEDMGEVGRNPGRIISAWQDFADEFASGSCAHTTSSSSATTSSRRRCAAIRTSRRATRRTRATATAPTR